MKYRVLIESVVKQASAVTCEIEQQVNHEFEELEEAARNCDEAGEPKKKAKLARQRLANPGFASTSLSTAVEAQARMRETLIEKCARSAAAVEKALADHAANCVALRWHEKKQQLYEAAKAAHPSRKHSPAEGEVTSDEMKFLKEMRDRGVPLHALGEGNGNDLDHFAFLLKDLAKPIGKRKRTGAWGRAFSAGALNIAVSEMSADEAEVLRLVWGQGYPEGDEAKKVLEEEAGRPLDISPSFAHMVLGVAEHHDVELLKGLQRNIATAERLGAQGRRSDEVRGDEGATTAGMPDQNAEAGEARSTLGSTSAELSSAETGGDDRRNIAPALPAPTLEAVTSTTTDQSAEVEDAVQHADLYLPTAFRIISEVVTDYVANFRAPDGQFDSGLSVKLLSTMETIGVDVSRARSVCRLSPAAWASAIQDMAGSEQGKVAELLFTDVRLRDRLRADGYEVP